MRTRVGEFQRSAFGSGVDVAATVELGNQSIVRPLRLRIVSI